MPKKQADLLFDKGPISGFAVLAEQSVFHPAIVVRELVQNSLDAAQEAGRKQTIVRFEIAKHERNDIPAFDSYKAAFNKAKKDQKKQDSALNVISSIETQIKSRKIETLFVMDNGIGLNEKGMDALLSKGISNKARGGAGSYGYGHTVFIPTSDLRYVLYGGLCKGKKIAAGHAVLASFMDSKEVKGGDGYFVIQKKEDMENPFIYPKEKVIPDIIKGKLDIIEEEWGSGSVVIAPGFNHFKEVIPDYHALDEKFLWKSIKKAAACNFYAAIAEGKLRIEYKDDENTESLDKKTISNVLEEYKDEKRTRHFLNGHRAYKAYNTMVHGKDHEVETSLGKVKIKLDQTVKEGRSQIDLCRNGMHITSSVRFLEHRDFTNYALFHCLILVDSSDNEFHRLIRKSEPPKHDGIEPKRLESTEKRQLDKTLKEIGDYLRETLEELKSDEFTINDVLNLKSYGINTLEELPHRVRAGGKGGGGSGGGGQQSFKGGAGSGGSDFKRAGRAVSFHATPVQTGKRSYAVQVALGESTYDNEIRFALDESLDLTCDNANTEDFVCLKNIKIDGKEVTKESLIKGDNGKVLGVNLGSGGDKQISLTFDFVLPDDTGIDEDTLVSLQAEIVRRQMEKAE